MESTIEDNNNMIIEKVPIKIREIKTSKVETKDEIAEELAIKKSILCEKMKILCKVLECEKKLKDVETLRYFELTKAEMKEFIVRKSKGIPTGKAPAAHYPYVELKYIISTYLPKKEMFIADPKKVSHVKPLADIIFNSDINDLQNDQKLLDEQLKKYIVEDKLYMAYSIVIEFIKRLTYVERDRHAYKVYEDPDLCEGLCIEDRI